MKVKVLSVTGDLVKEINLNDSVWNIEPHQQALYDTVISQRAALRQGTKKVKTRAEVRGGGRKPWRQKGTGRARQGSIRAPQWKGGGVAFGPNPNINYKKSVNRKVRQLAMKSALSVKATDIVVLDKFIFNKPSTKEMISIVKNVNLDTQKVLILTRDKDDLVNKSAGNLQNIKTLNVAKLNVYDLLNASKLLITEDAIKAIEEVYV
ncbi:50S ribosomal protein L4 [Spiroplasma endosymbiont of Aspidapion aeneum]|uniref:50S ribosomal protein L4 n=1 Tax=Spiroplasma endosymbiont of Aspidapion aeneum TaxID=3066276 RepID=UPI00313EFDF3